MQMDQSTPAYLIHQAHRAVCGLHGSSSSCSFPLQPHPRNPRARRRLDRGRGRCHLDRGNDCGGRRGPGRAASTCPGAGHGPSAGGAASGHPDTGRGPRTGGAASGGQDADRGPSRAGGAASGGQDTDLGPSRAGGVASCG
jgi:hypothetical protein